MLDSLLGRGIYFDFWKDAIYIDGHLTLADLEALVAHIKVYGYKEPPC